MVSQLIDILRSRLCSSLTIREAERIVDATVPHRVPAGADICSEGDRPPGLIFLVRGTGDILLKTPVTGSPVIGTVEGPTMLGEVSLLTGRPVSATVRARTECECYILTRPQLQRLLETESLAISKLALAIAASLALKLTAMNERVAERAPG